MLRNSLPGAFKVVLVETDGDAPAKEASVRRMLEAAGHVLTHELRLGQHKGGGWGQVYMLETLVRGRKRRAPEVVRRGPCVDADGINNCDRP